MTIESMQKVIKVGSSLSVTIPAKDARFYNVKAGEILRIRYERPEGVDVHQAEVVEIARNLIKRHEKALASLSQR
jgi:bifunctional DNA-binding transcriptional regulator/antitoxin component of YhaV-PrlF toxin-antitoxin module